MGKLEQEAKIRRRKGEIERAILATVATVGILSIALIAPKALDQLKYLPGNKARFAFRARTVAGRLVAKGYAMWINRDGKKYLRLTQAGQKIVQFEKEKVALMARKGKRWDHRWRMVVFDVPERRRKVRRKLCAIMREVGFMRLQDSVWVYPYDCENLIVLLKADLKIGKDVLYAIVETIEHDAPLRQHFELSTS